MQLLHTMLRVGNLDRSIEFYTKVMGMNLLRRTERPEQNTLWHLLAMNKAISLTKLKSN